MRKGFDREAFARRMKEARDNVRASQAKAAQALGVEQPSISRWERGAALPSLDLLVRAADLYDVPIDWLVYGTVTMPAREAQAVLEQIAEMVLPLIRPQAGGGAGGDADVEAVALESEEQPEDRLRRNGA